MPTYARRWAVQGRTPTGDTATTIFDRQRGHPLVTVYPATLAGFAVVVGPAAIRQLAETARTGTACAVPAEHAEHGRRLLGLRPHTTAHEPSWLDRPADAPPYPGPLELYLVLPRAEVRIVYRHDRQHLLARALTEIADTLT